MPSIGSTTHVTAPSTALPPPSSPTTGSPGRSCASRSRTSVSNAVSEAVTTSVGVLFVDTPAGAADRSVRCSHGRGRVCRCTAAAVTTCSAMLRSVAGSSDAGSPGGEVMMDARRSFTAPSDHTPVDAPGRRW